MICRICTGTGYLLFTKVWKWWTCPCCGGSGVSVQHGAAFVGPGTRRRRKS